MLQQTVYTCHNCDGASSRVTVYDDGYTLCLRCKRAMQDRYEGEAGWMPTLASPEDEALRARAER